MSVSLVQDSWCPYKRGNLGTDIDTHTQGECHVKMVAAAGVVLLQTEGTKECQQPLEVQGEAWDSFFFIVLRKNEPP